MRLDKKPGQREINKKYALIAMGLALAVAIAICALVGPPMLRFASDPDKFRAWVDMHGIMGRLAYIGMVVLQILLAFIPGEPLEIAAGYAFGPIEGTLLCLLASGLGSALVIWLGRRYGVRLVEIFFSREKIESMRFLQMSARRKAIFFIIFAIPGTPKDFLCYYAGLTDIKLSHLIIICSIARIPSIITSTLGGDALGTQNYILAAIVFGATLLVSGVGLLIYDGICKKNRAKQQLAQLPAAEHSQEQGQACSTERNTA